MIRANDSSDDSQSVFHQYMLASLQGSIEYTKRLAERSYNAAQLFITLITALTGVLVIVITSVSDSFLRVSIIALIAAVASSVGVLTYIWILTTIAQQRREETVRYFLEKYFRDLAPQSFDKYGLSQLGGGYSAINVYLLKNHAYQAKSTITSFSQGAAIASLVSLGIFSSTLIAVAIYTGWGALTGDWNFVNASLAGFIVFLILLGSAKVIDRHVETNYILAQSIFADYHLEQNDTKKNLVDDTATA